MERALECVVPLWNESLSYKNTDQKRIKCTGLKYGEPMGPRPIWPGDIDQGDIKKKDGPEREEFDSGASSEDGDEEEDLGEDSDQDKLGDAELDEEMHFERWNNWEKSRPVILPEPDEFKPMDVLPGDRINLRENFPDTKLQVIVKLANIELTPGKPEYEGGSWHLEGSLVSNVVAISAFLLSTDSIRTSVSAQRPSTITTVKTSQKTHCPFVNVGLRTGFSWLSSRGVWLWP